MQLPDHIVKFELKHSKSKSKLKTIQRPDTAIKSSRSSNDLGLAEGGTESRGNDSSDTDISMRELFAPPVNAEEVDYSKMIPGLNYITARQLASLRKKTKENSSNISRLLSKASEIDSRRRGIGSRGGPIARKIKAPGPHNGHNRILPHERLISAKLELPDASELQQVFKDIEHPQDWDINFVTAASISQGTYHPVTLYSALKLEINNLTHRKSMIDPISSPAKHFIAAQSSDSNSFTELLSSSPKKIETNELFNIIDRYELKDAKDYLKACNTSYLLNECNAIHYSEEGYNESQEKIVLNAEIVWDEKINTLHNYGMDVLHIDLWEISQVLKPSPELVHTVGYLCILLELSPSWKSCQAHIFVELNQILKFLRNIEPLAIPSKRLRHCVRYYGKHFNVDMFKALETYVQVSKLLRWIIAFHDIALKIMKVENKLIGRQSTPKLPKVSASGGVATDEEASKKSPSKAVFGGRKKVEPDESKLKQNMLKQEFLLCLISVNVQEDEVNNEKKYEEESFEVEVEDGNDGLDTSTSLNEWGDTENDMHKLGAIVVVNEAENKASDDAMTMATTEPSLPEGANDVKKKQKKVVKIVDSKSDEKKTDALPMVAEKKSQVKADKGNKTSQSSEKGKKIGSVKGKQVTKSAGALSSIPASTVSSKMVSAESKIESKESKDDKDNNDNDDKKGDEYGDDVDNEEKEDEKAAKEDAKRAERVAKAEMERLEVERVAKERAAEADKADKERMAEAEAEKERMAEAEAEAEKERMAEAEAERKAKEDSDRRIAVEKQRAELRQRLQEEKDKKAREAKAKEEAEVFSQNKDLLDDDQLSVASQESHKLAEALITSIITSSPQHSPSKKEIVEDDYADDEFDHFDD